MTADRERVLDPMERISEILFGLIMVLTFTGSFRVAGADRDDVGTMLIGALGCNAAWGVIDAVFYLMGALAERSRSLMALRGVRSARTPEEGRRVLADALPSAVAQVVDEEEFERWRARLTDLPEPPERARLGWDDARGAVGVCLLVFLSTFPVAVPFLFMREVEPALRVSNAIAVTMLLLLGVAYGRYTGRRPWVTGVAMLVLGLVLVGLTIALGG